MVPTPQVSYADMIQLAKEGSPMLINAVSRLAGLGTAERDLLATKGVPTWAWVAVAGGACLVIGIRLHKKYPNRVPSWIKGK